MSYLKKSLLTPKTKSSDTPTDNLLTDLLECKDLLDTINNLGVYEKDIYYNSNGYDDEHRTGV
jgi:hypothetical protein